MNLAVINPFDLAGSIEKTFKKWLTDVMESFFKFIADGLFSGTELSGIFKQMNTIFIAIGSSVIICIVLYRIIVGMLSEGEGKTQDQLFSELAIGGVKVGMMIYLLPILLSFCLNKIIYPFCKYLFVYRFSYNQKEFDYIFDMVVYAVYVSLGFALFENILYVMSGGIGVGIIRAFTAIPMHASAGVMMGHFLGEAKYNELNKKSGTSYKILALLVPTLIHGTYDYSAFKDNWSLLLIILVVFVIFSVLIVNHKSRNDVRVAKCENCPRCGTKIISKFCVKCGLKIE